MELKNRTQSFMGDLGVPMTRFAMRIGLCRQSIYRWLKGDIRLSNDALKRIDTFLTKYGF